MSRAADEVTRQLFCRPDKLEEAPMDTARTDDMVHVTRWHWGDKEWSPFSALEMDYRHGALRDH